MSSWGTLDRANNAPQWGVVSGYGGGNANGSIVYHDSNIGDFVAGETIGLYKDNNTVSQSGSNEGPGWTLSIQSAGYVSGVSLTGNAVPGYTDNETGFVTFVGGGGSGANASFTANSTGFLTSVALANAGVYISAPTAWANGNGKSSLVSVNMGGGRFGRTKYEVLVALTT